MKKKYNERKERIQFADRKNCSLRGWRMEETNQFRNVMIRRSKPGHVQFSKQSKLATSFFSSEFVSIVSLPFLSVSTRVVKDSRFCPEIRGIAFHPYVCRLMGCRISCPSSERAVSRRSGGNQLHISYLIPYRKH